MLYCNWKRCIKKISSFNFTFQEDFKTYDTDIVKFMRHHGTREAVVHLNFRAMSTFPVPVCTVSSARWVNKAATQ